MARKVALLLWGTVWGQCHTTPPEWRCPRGATPSQPSSFSLPAQTLSLTGAQTSQLLMDPPWTPAVVWDKVTLICQGLGTSGVTTWFRDGKLWSQTAAGHYTVAVSGTYNCHRACTGFSPSVSVIDDWLVLQVPVRPLLEGDTVTLRCRGMQNQPVTSVSFYREKEELGRSGHGTELSLSPLQLNHSGNYRCKGLVSFGTSLVLQESNLVTVTVHGVPVSGVSLSAQPPGGQVALGDSLVLSCTVAAGRGPLSFSWHREGSGTPLGTGAKLELSKVGKNDSGHYQCRVSDGESVAESPTLNVTVLVPVANATITPGPSALQVRAGDPVTLHCSVQVGSAPVTFTWLHNRHEVAQGPLLDLGDIDVGHSGTYQCVATNQLDEHRVFRALSPELPLDVTAERHLGTAVAVNVGRTLLFLVLLLAVIGGCHWWHTHMATRKSQDRALLEPLAPPKQGEVLNIKQAEGTTSDQHGAAETPRVTARIQ